MLQAQNDKKYKAKKRNTRLEKQIGQKNDDDFVEKEKIITSQLLLQKKLPVY